jgi:hypothetical protein
MCMHVHVDGASDSPPTRKDRGCEPKGPKRKKLPEPGSFEVEARGIEPRSERLRVNGSTRVSRSEYVGARLRAS